MMTTMLANVIRHYLAESTDAQSQLDDQHHATHSENNSAVTSVLPDPESVIPPQPARELVVTPVIPVTPQNSKDQQNNVNKLYVQDQTKLLAYLKAIGETDSLVIEEFLSECAASPDILHPASRIATGRRYPANSPRRYEGIRALCQLSISASVRTTMQSIRLADCGG